MYFDLQEEMGQDWNSESPEKAIGIFWSEGVQSQKQAEKEVKNQMGRVRKDLKLAQTRGRHGAGLRSESKNNTIKLLERKTQEKIFVTLVTKEFLDVYQKVDP